MAEASDMQQLFVQAAYEEILKLADGVNHEQIRESISKSSPQKILTGALLTVTALLTTLMVKKKGAQFLTRKFQSNIVYLAEMLVWKANQTVKQLCDEVLHQREVLQKLQCLDKLCEEMKKLKFDLEHIKGLDVSNELISLTERKMADIDEKMRDIERSCERRIRDYDWKLTALTANQGHQPTTHVDIINQHVEHEAEAQAVQQHMNKQARVKMSLKRL